MGLQKIWGREEHVKRHHRNAIRPTQNVGNRTSIEPTARVFNKTMARTKVDESVKDKKTQFIWNLLHGTNGSIYRKKKKFMDLETRFVVAKGEEEGVGWTGSWVCRCKLLHLEWISHEVLL